MSLCNTCGQREEQTKHGDCQQCHDERVERVFEAIHADEPEDESGQVTLADF